MTVDDTLNRTNLTSKTVAQLREICREKSLLISGKKAELIDRILESIDVEEKVEDSEALILDDEREEINQNKENNNYNQDRIEQLISKYSDTNEEKLIDISAEPKKFNEDKEATFEAEIIDADLVVDETSKITSTPKNLDEKIEDNLML